MTQIEILAVVTPVIIVTSVILTVWIANYFDEKKAEAERRAKAAGHDAPASAAE
jgi:type II secretory pathway pseudopilin PulG